MKLSVNIPVGKHSSTRISGGIWRDFPVTAVNEIPQESPYLLFLASHTLTKQEGTTL